jgi:ABC-type nickel/cobalt efflux system permease component RcnA
MNSLPETTINLLLSAIMGAISSVLTIPVNAWILWKLKRGEQDHQHKLDIIAKEKELVLQHRLEMKRMQQSDFHHEITVIKETIKKIELRLDKQTQGSFE